MSGVSGWFNDHDARPWWIALAGTATPGTDSVPEVWAVSTPDEAMR